MQPNSLVRTHLVPLLGIILPVLVFHHEILFWQGVICGGDFINQFVPWRQFALSELASGRFPGWNPYTFCGTPFAANIQTSLFYPFNLLHVLLPVERLFSWSLVVHHLLAGVLMYGFLYRQMRHEWAAAFGAVVFAWSGFLITHAHDGHLIHIRACAWIPAVLWTQQVLLERGSVRAFWGMSVSFALMFYGGHTQIPLYLFYFVLARALWHCIHLRLESTPWKTSALPLLKTCATLGCAIGLSMLVLLPLASLSRDTAGRAGGADYSFATSDSMPPGFLATFIAPFAWGNPTAELREQQFWLTGTGYHELCGYVGILTLALLPLIALRSGDHPPHPWWKRLFASQTAFYATAMLGGLFFALGEYNPLYPLLYYGLPGWSYFRVPARLVLVFIIGASICSAAGLAAWFRTPWQQARQQAALKLSAVASLLVGFGTLSVWLSREAILESMRMFEVERTIEATGIWTASRSRIAAQLPEILFEMRFAELITSLGLATALLAIGWLALALVKCFKRHWLQAAPLAVLVLDLLLFSQHFIQVKPQETWRDTYYPETGLITTLRETAGDQRVIELDPAIGHPGLAYHPELRPNRLMGYGIRSARGYDPIILQRYATAVNRLYGRPDRFPQGGLLFFSEAPSPRDFAAFATPYLITVSPLPEPWQLLWHETDSGFRLYENPYARPETYWANGHNSSAITSEQSTPGSRVVLAETPVADTLVFAIPYTENWKASADGEPVMTEPYNDTWLSVPLSPGTHRIEVSYRDQPMFVGGILTLVTLIAMLAGTWRTTTRANTHR